MLRIYLLILFSNTLLSVFGQGDTLLLKKLLAESWDLRLKGDTAGRKLIDSAERMLNDKTPDLLRSKVYRTKADIVAMQGDKKSSVAYFELAIKFSKDNMRLGNLYAGLGSIHLNTGDMEKAIANLHKSLGYYDIARDSNQWNVKNDLAICYAQTGRTQEALRYFRDIFRIQKRLNLGPARLAETYVNMGVVYEMENKSDSVKAAYVKALDILMPEGNSSSLAMLLNNLGVLSVKAKEIETGKKYLSRALNMMLAIGDVHKAALLLNNMADIMRGAGKMNEAVHYALRAYTISDSTGNLRQKISACGHLSAIYSKGGDFKNAWYYSNRYSRLNDSLNGIEKMKSIAEMESKYESEKKEKAIQLLSKDSELKKSQLSREKNFRYFMIGLAALVLMIALLLFYNLRTKQRVNRELDLKNRKIEQAYLLIEEKQKEILDSIHYAKRIQESFLPNQKSLERKMTNVRKSAQ